MKLIATVTTIAAATILATVGVGGQLTHADSVSDLKQTLATKQNANDGLQTQLQKAQDAVSTVDAKMTAKTIAIQDTADKIDTLGTKVAGYDTKITKAKAEVAKRTAALKAQLQALQKQAGDSVTGNVYVDFVLNAQSLDEVISRSATVGKLNAANAEALSDVQAAQSHLAKLKQAATADAADLKAEKAKLETSQAQLKTLAGQLQTKQATLQKQLSENQTAVSALQGDIAKANAEAKAQATKAAATQAAAKPAEKDAVQPKATIAAATKTATQVAKPAATPKASGNAGGMVGIAERYIGVPYVWGGTSPSGFDCSGLVVYAASQMGISLPRTAAAMSNVGSSVSLSALQPGDLLFWGGVGSASHVAIYVGGGQYIHAPEPGQSVTIQSMSYYAPSFAKRL